MAAADGGRGCLAPPRERRSSVRWEGEGPWLLPTKGRSQARKALPHLL